MTQMEIYLLSLGSVALFLGGYAIGAVIELRRSHLKTTRELAEYSTMDLKLAEIASQHGDAIRELAQIAVRHGAETADLKTRVMALSKREGK